MVLPHGCKYKYMCFYFLLVPATGIPLSSFWHIQVTYLLESAVSTFSRSPSGRADTFSFLFLPSIPRICMSMYSSDATLFRSASFSLLSIHSSTSAMYFPNLQVDITSFWFPPILFHTFSINYAIPPFSSSSFSNLLPYSSIDSGRQPLFWRGPHFILQFQLPHIYIYPCLF